MLAVSSVCPERVSFSHTFSVHSKKGLSEDIRFPIEKDLFPRFLRLDEGKWFVRIAFLEDRTKGAIIPEEISLLSIRSLQVSSGFGCVGNRFVEPVCFLTRNDLKKNGGKAFSRNGPYFQLSLSGPEQDLVFYLRDSVGARLSLKGKFAPSDFALGISVLQMR